MSLVSELWWTGVRAAGGRASVQRAIEADPGILGRGSSAITSVTNKTSQAVEIIAVGKAAASMARGALEHLPADTQGIVVTKRGHLGGLAEDYPQLEVIESGHPIPDVESLLAGQRLYDRVRALPKESHLLLLISGGASALVERLPPGVSLLDWQRKTEALVASGADIREVNSQRSKLSLIKSGRLLKAFGGASVAVLAISDVSGDSHAVIGSGLGDTRYLTCPAQSATIATNAIARSAIVAAAQAQGLVVQENGETLYGDNMRLPSVSPRRFGRARQVFMYGVVNRPWYCQKIRVEADAIRPWRLPSPKNCTAVISGWTYWWREPMVRTARHRPLVVGSAIPLAIRLPN